MHIFARSSNDLDPAVVANTIENSWYGKGSVTVAHDDVDQRRILVKIPGAQKPIVLYRDTDPETISVMRSEQLTEHTDVPPGVVQHLQSAQQVLSIEIFPEELDDDGWELLDVLESFLARQLDGIVVGDDGVYDADLKRLTS